MRIIKRLLVLFIIAMLGCGMFYYYRKQQQKSATVQKMAEKYNVLLKQVREERAKLEEEFKLLHEGLTIPDKGSTIVLLADTRTEHLDDALYIMDEEDYYGVIALSPYCFPDDNIEGYLNRQQIDELVSKNFELVISINNEDIEKTYNSFINKGYDIKGFYFENIKVNKAKIEAIKKLNPELVIIGNFEGELYYDDYLLINSYGSKQSGVKTAYKDSIGVSKTVALVVGYENSKNQYTYENFVAMLELIDDYEYYNQTALCNITEAKLRFEDYLLALAEAKPDEINRIEEIKERLATIDKTLLEVSK